MKMNRVHTRRERVSSAPIRQVWFPLSDIPMSVTKVGHKPGNVTDKSDSFKQKDHTA